MNTICIERSALNMCYQILQTVLERLKHRKYKWICIHQNAIIKNHTKKLIPPTPQLLTRKSIFCPIRRSRFQSQDNVQDLKRKGALFYGPEWQQQLWKEQLREPLTIFFWLVRAAKEPRETEREREKTAWSPLDIEVLPGSTFSRWESETH